MHSDFTMSGGPVATVVGGKCPGIVCPGEGAYVRGANLSGECFFL